MATGVLNPGTSAAIKRACYGNVTGFYEKYHSMIKLTASTFYRIVNGSYSAEINIRHIEKFAKDLGLLNEYGESVSLVKDDLIVKWLEICDKLNETPSIEHLDKLREFVNKYRVTLLT